MPMGVGSQKYKASITPSRNGTKSQPSAIFRARADPTDSLLVVKRVRSTPWSIQGPPQSTRAYRSLSDQKSGYYSPTLDSRLSLGIRASASGPDKWRYSAPKDTPRHDGTSALRMPWQYL